MKNTICGYDVLSDLFAERYIAGELGDVAESKETERLSAQVEGFIAATVSGEIAAAKLNELLCEYTASIMRDTFAAGLAFGVQAGLDVRRRLGDRGPSE